MSRDEILSQIEILKSQVLQKQAILKDQRQSINETQKEISRYNNRREILTRELEDLKTKKQRKFEQLLKQHSCLREEVTHLQTLHSQQYIEHETELQGRINYLKSCQDEMNVLEQEKSLVKPELDPNCTSSMSMLNLIEELRNQLGELQEILSSEALQNEQLAVKFKNTKEEMKNIGDQCDDKKSTIQEANSLKETLDCDRMALKAELFVLGSGVKEVDHKPNSLFDEVNENRVTLQSSVSKMNESYEEMKKKRNDLLKQLQTLQQEKARLKYRCEETMEDSHFDMFVMKYTNKDFVLMLQNLNKELQRFIDERNVLQGIVITPKESELFFKILDKVDVRIRELDTQIGKARYTNSNLHLKILDIKKNIAGLQAKIKEAENTNAGLRADINVLQEKEVCEKLICICTLRDAQLKI